jgi:hypothetical protein
VTRALQVLVQDVLGRSLADDSADMRDVDRERAIRAGFNLHIPKSSQPSNLIQAVLGLVRGRPPPPTAERAPSR